MPLEEGNSPKIVSHNVVEMVKAGHPQAQAVAAAEHEAKDDAGTSCMEVGMTIPEMIKKNRELWEPDKQGGGK